MPTNRTVTITGIFAESANTTIPENPVSGIAYRNTSLTESQIRTGWPFKTIVDSSNFNQSMFEIFSISKQFEQYGFLPWSSLTDYPQGGFALGSDGVLYQAVQATGPSTTALDPTNDTSMTYWKAVQFGNKTGMISLYGGTTPPEGWLICDGSAISRTTYASLFSVIGTTYGEGDGSTTFNIPNGKAPLGGEIPCKGNGMAIGFTNSTTLSYGRTSTYDGSFMIQAGYGEQAGVPVSAGSMYRSETTVGLTTDATKSGIVADIEKASSVCNVIIKY